MDRRVPPLDLRPRPEHALRLIDLAVIAGIFFLVGQLYMNSKGAERLQNSEKIREVARLQGSRLIEEADSVMAAKRAELAEMQADSVQWVSDLAQRRATYEATRVELEGLSQAVFPLSDMIIDFRQRVASGEQKVRGYEKEIAGREKEIENFDAEAKAAEDKLEKTRQEREQVAVQLQGARKTRAYEPVGMFPSQSGVMVQRETGGANDMTNVELQHNVWKAGVMDVGVALGVGFGAQNDASNKQLGLLVTRPLIHRRLGLDFGAGYSLLTDATGQDNSTPYASASLRLSPFYRERFHFGLGARANQDEVMPFIGVGVGRR